MAEIGLSSHRLRVPCPYTSWLLRCVSAKCDWTDQNCPCRDNWVLWCLLFQISSAEQELVLSMRWRLWDGESEDQLWRWWVSLPPSNWPNTTWLNQSQSSKFWLNQSESTPTFFCPVRHRPVKGRTLDVMIYEAQFQPLNYSFGALFFLILLVLLFPLVSQMSEPTHWQPDTSKDIIDVLIENFRSLIIPLWHSLSMATVTVC